MNARHQNPSISLSTLSTNRINGKFTLRSPCSRWTPRPDAREAVAEMAGMAGMAAGLGSPRRLMRDFVLVEPIIASEGTKSWRKLLDCYLRCYKWSGDIWRYLEISGEKCGSHGMSELLILQWLPMVSAQRLDQEFAVTTRWNGRLPGRKLCRAATKWPAKPTEVSGFPGSAWDASAMAYLQTVLCFESNYLPHERLHHDWIASIRGVGDLENPVVKPPQSAVSKKKPKRCYSHRILSFMKHVCWPSFRKISDHDNHDENTHQKPC